MSRWQPDAQERLEHAALELFLEQGFASTTVPQITARAGLTTRTFFRHFTDKREVLFAGDDVTPAQMARLFTEAPPSLDPMTLLLERLGPGAVEVFAERSVDYLRRRRQVIDAEPALQERELRKFSLMARALKDGFLERGADELTASVAADIGVSAFRIGATRWIASDGTTDVAAEISRALFTLQQVVGRPDAAG